MTWILLITIFLDPAQYVQIPNYKTEYGCLQGGEVMAQIWAEKGVATTYTCLPQTNNS